MAERLRTLIVDDEPLARAGLSEFVERTDFLQEIGQARNGMEALELLENRTVDLLLLDVQMPGLSGTELLRALSRPPLAIFTTAHPDFAVEGFELNAIDYLLKPIAFPRFLQAALKAKARFAPTAPPSGKASAPAAAPTDIFVREEGRMERIVTADIRYAEAMQNYCRIHTPQRSYLPLLPLGELEERLSAGDFLRIHRSYLVNIHYVEGVIGNQVRVGKELLPISRSKREEVMRRLVGDRLL